MQKCICELTNITAVIPVSTVNYRINKYMEQKINIIQL